MKINPYLNFNGNCGEAFHFYAKVLNGKDLRIMTFADAPPGMPVSPETKTQVMHARFSVGGDTIMGSDAPGDTAHLHFPGIAKDAALLLVERKIAGVGIDTASMDHGPTKDFPTHRVFGEANIPGLENLANLDKVPTRGAFLQALPMKIEGGTGGPCRVIAWVP